MSVADLRPTKFEIKRSIERAKADALADVLKELEVSEATITGGGRSTVG